MDYLRARGYPVPAIDDVSDDGTEVVMEKIEGPSMVALMGRRPWRLRQQGAVLAELHRRLHEIVAPDWLPPAPGDRGDRVLHLDLHPLNVIASRNGPVVIDWANASRGVGDVDVAVAWLLIASGEMPFGRLKSTALQRGRKVFLDSFLRGCDLRAARQHLGRLAEWKAQDPNMTDAERGRMREVIAVHSTA